MTLELAARGAVLLACAVAAGVLLVLLAPPAWLRPAVEPSAPRPLAGLLPASLGAFILLAGGTALTGAGTIPPSGLPDAAAAAGIALLAVVGLVTARGTLRVLTARHGGAVGGPSAVPSTHVVVIAWAGAALALASLVLAAGAALLAILAGVGLEHDGA